MSRSERRAFDKFNKIIEDELQRDESITLKESFYKLNDQVKVYKSYQVYRNARSRNRKSKRD